LIGVPPHIGLDERGQRRFAPGRISFRVLVRVGERWVDDDDPSTAVSMYEQGQDRHSCLPPERKPPDPDDQQSPGELDSEGFAPERTVSRDVHERTVQQQLPDSIEARQTADRVPGGQAYCFLHLEGFPPGGISAGRLEATSDPHGVPELAQDEPCTWRAEMESQQNSSLGRGAQIFCALDHGAFAEIVGIRYTDRGFVRDEPAVVREYCDGQLPPSPPAGAL
jgi:hypothetical protein